MTASAMTGVLRTPAIEQFECRSSSIWRFIFLKIDSIQFAASDDKAIIAPIKACGLTKRHSFGFDRSDSPLNGILADGDALVRRARSRFCVSQSCRLATSGTNRSAPARRTSYLKSQHSVRYAAAIRSTPIPAIYAVTLRWPPTFLPNC